MALYASSMLDAGPETPDDAGRLQALDQLQDITFGDTCRSGDIRIRSPRERDVILQYPQDRLFFFGKIHAGFHALKKTPSYSGTDVIP